MAIGVSSAIGDKSGAVDIGMGQTRYSTKLESKKLTSEKNVAS
jgi:hypothetical protein